jgi:hypothetical protein
VERTGHFVHGQRVDHPGRIDPCFSIDRLGAKRKVMRWLAKQYQGLNKVLFAMVAERLGQIEMPRSAGMDQSTLRLLRTKVVE